MRKRLVVVLLSLVAFVAVPSVASAAHNIVPEPHCY